MHAHTKSKDRNDETASLFACNIDEKLSFQVSSSLFVLAVCCCYWLLSNLANRQSKQILILDTMHARLFLSLWWYLHFQVIDPSGLLCRYIASHTLCLAASHQTLQRGRYRQLLRLPLTDLHTSVHDGQTI